MVAVEPDQRPDYTNLTVRAKNRNTGAMLNGKVLVKTLPYPRYFYGDVLKISCQLKSPSTIIDEVTGRAFAYDKYLARYGIYSICQRSEIKIIRAEQGNSFLASLYKIKRGFVRAVQHSLPEPTASFLAGLLIGAKKSIPAELMDDFNRTGTTHIVALSGFNITIIGVLISNICRRLWLSRRQSFLVSLLAIAFFVLITGAASSVVRAGIMGTIVLLAQQSGRLSRVANTLALAALIMVAINPYILAYDAGFQLSFLATIGLVYLSPVVGKYASKIPEFFSLRENFSATISAIVMTTPLIMFQFGRFSVVAVLVNLLVLPVVPWAMALGFISTIISWIWLPLGQIAAWPTWLVLKYIIVIIHYFSQLKYASVSLPTIGISWLVLSYLFLAGLLIWLNINPRKNKNVAYATK